MQRPPEPASPAISTAQGEQPRNELKAIGVLTSTADLSEQNADRARVVIEP
jgi:hypothetical protein